MGKPKLLWHSNSPWAPTGYGAQSALFLPRLNEHYQTVCSAFYGLSGNILPWKGIPILPGVGETFGNETILDHVDQLFENRRDGLVVALMDSWVLDPQVWRKINAACWAPIDCSPAPQRIVDFFQLSGSIPIAMSKNGRDAFEAAGLDPLYCPHAVDTGIYHPIDQKAARKETQLPEDAFVVGMVAANKGNPSRKCFSEAFQAFKAFRASHPEAVLYVQDRKSVV